MKSLISVLLLVCFCYAQDQSYSFSDEFLFGVATASYQVEGAWNETGKGVNIWDYMTHTNPDKIDDQSNGDVACDAYHKTADDVQLLYDMGVDFYRFSISWPRILPSGHANYINEDGIRYYNELIDELLAYNITPLVTMYHWDLPQALQEIGGWPNPDLADIFADFANVLYSEFGDRVKDWITFNEPYQVCQQGYSDGEKAPSYTQDGVGGYLCGYTLLLAHAKAYQLYDENYREEQQGRVGFAISGVWYEPETDSEEDQLAAESRMQFYFGWWAHPIFSDEGDYPAVMKEAIDAKSADEGFSSSRLPTFTQDEIDLIQGSSDFLGLNHYTTNLCTQLEGDTLDRPSFLYDTGADCYQSPEWEDSASTWLKVVPWGLRSHLNWIKEQYNNVEVIITESGYSDNVYSTDDCRRVNYYNSYLEQLLLAIYEDDCNVTGYTAWSFMDNFEWMQGYTERFGIHLVDFDDPDRPRTPKRSSQVLKNIIETRVIDWDYTPEGFEACDWNITTR